MATMDKHVSRWFHVQSVPENYTFPVEYRPGDIPIPVCNQIPVIDLGKSSDTDTIQQIMKASKEFGFFQVINHGVLENLTKEALQVMTELLNMPSEEIAQAAKKGGWVYLGEANHDVNGVHMWRDNIKHPCHPLDDCVHLWPEKPARYREVFAAYTKEMRKLSLKILGLITEGLGIEKGYLEGNSQVQFLAGNHYPPCPDPSLTLGILKHTDPSLITIVLQSVAGLQVFKDGDWIGVESIPNAFVVNIGNQLEIISNRKLKSAEHRVVPNKDEARTSIATFIIPSPSCIIEPAKVLVNDESNPPPYAPQSYKDYVMSCDACGPSSEALIK